MMMIVITVGFLIIICVREIYKINVHKTEDHCLGVHENVVGY